MNQMNEKYDVKNERIMRYKGKVCKLLQFFKDIKFKNINIYDNEEADYLAVRAFFLEVTIEISVMTLGHPSIKVLKEPCPIEVKSIQDSWMTLIIKFLNEG